MENEIRRTGKIRRWTGDTWGFANSYNGEGTLTRVFVHQKNLKDQSQQLGLDIRISFTLGEPRRPGECPVALQIEVIGGAS